MAVIKLLYWQKITSELEVATRLWCCMEQLAKQHLKLIAIPFIIYSDLHRKIQWETFLWYFVLFYRLFIDYMMVFMVSYLALAEILLNFYNIYNFLFQVQRKIRKFFCFHTFNSSLLHVVNFKINSILSFGIMQLIQLTANIIFKEC